MKKRKISSFSEIRYFGVEIGFVVHAYNYGNQPNGALLTEIVLCTNSINPGMLHASYSIYHEVNIMSKTPEEYELDNSHELLRKAIQDYSVENIALFTTRQGYEILMDETILEKAFLVHCFVGYEGAHKRLQVSCGGLSKNVKYDMAISDAEIMGELRGMMGS